MSVATDTIKELVEPLPDNVQAQIVEQVKQYIAEIQSEHHWQNLYQQTNSKLTEIAQKAKQQIANGKAESMDFDKL